MRKVLILLVFCIIYFLVSCKSTILRIAGLREPKIENKMSILTFLEELGEDTNNVYTLDSALFQQLRKESFKPGMTKGFRPIQIRIYGKNEDPVVQWASCEGYLSDLKIFDSMPPKVINGLDTSITLGDDLDRYFTLDGKPANIMFSNSYDYYILVYFAKYFPKLSKESFSQVNRYIKIHPEKRFKVFKINVDVQEFWNADLQIDSQIQAGGEN
jgi:hypothetical protein